MKVNTDVKIANFITITAKPGKEQELQDFLAGGAAAVTSTEPQTVCWFSVRINNNTFAIIDFFNNQAGQDAHLNGLVAASLKQKAADLIEGGWENGVLKNFQAFDVLSGSH